MKLIDADALIAELNLFFPVRDGITFETGFRQILTDIRNAPEIDSAKRGHWIAYATGENECSVCHGKNTPYQANYCIDCGAKMYTHGKKKGISPEKYIRCTIGEPAVWEQLAGSCCEAAKWALDAARVVRNTESRCLLDDIVEAFEAKYGEIINAVEVTGRVQMDDLTVKRSAQIADWVNKAKEMEKE